MRETTLLRQKVVEDLAIVTLLHLWEHDVTDLTEHLGVSSGNMSQPLALLRARLFFSISDPRIAALINCALVILDDDMSLTGEIRRAIQQVRLQP